MTRFMTGWMRCLVKLHLPCETTRRGASVQSCASGSCRFSSEHTAALLSWKSFKVDFGCREFKKKQIFVGVSYSSMSFIISLEYIVKVEVNKKLNQMWATNFTFKYSAVYITFFKVKRYRNTVTLELSTQRILFPTCYFVLNEVC